MPNSLEFCIIELPGDSLPLWCNLTVFLVQIHSFGTSQEFEHLFYNPDFDRHFLFNSNFPRILCPFHVLSEDFIKTVTESTVA